MRTRRRSIEDLRRAIDCLPVQTRVSMLQGMETYDIIVGAYVDRQGGVCPMLAAHRCGGRTDFISFAHAWDGFAGARARARRASERELRVLRTHLEASLFDDESVDFQTVIADYVARRDGHGRVRPGDPDRTRELSGRPGWSWLVPVRRLDDYERALARVEAQRTAEHDAESAPEREPALR